MSNHENPTCQAVVRNNQWWFGNTDLRSYVESAATIRLGVAKRACPMSRARASSGGRPTLSFRFDRDEDRAYWRSLHGQIVSLELLAVDDRSPTSTEPQASIKKKSAELRGRITPNRDSKVQFVPTCWPDDIPARRVLCVGVDPAWFGGQARRPSSQFDTIVYGVVDRVARELYGPSFQRLKLSDARVDADPYANCDPEAERLFECLRSIVNSEQVDGIVVAIDAPLCANGPKSADFRTSTTKKGSERRGCEKVLSRALRGQAAAWAPKIQPGIPLCKRVVRIIERLRGNDFTLYPAVSSRIVIECFPSETIWSSFVLSQSRRWHAFTEGGVSLPGASRVRAYKSMNARRLGFGEYARAVSDSLTVIDELSGLSAVRWNQVAAAVISWLSQDENFVDVKTGLGRGGKLLDDVVDATFSLAAAIGFALDSAHVWAEPGGGSDHIIGPGNASLDRK